MEKNKIRKMEIHSVKFIIVSDTKTPYSVLTTLENSELVEGKTGYILYPKVNKLLELLSLKYTRVGSFTRK